MKLLLRRNQRSGLIGKMIFTLEVGADLFPEERGAIDKYKLGDPGSGLLGFASRVAVKAIEHRIGVAPA